MFWSNNMKFKFTSGLFVFSLILNSIFISMFIMAALSKSSSLYYQSVQDDYTTAAAVISLPVKSEAAFELITIALKPSEKAYLQFSFVSSGKRQANLLINSLYDPEIVSITQTGYGIEIHALHEGETLMQTVTNDGIKNVALIRVEK